MDLPALWQAVLGELEVSISRASFATWFKNTAIIAQEEGHMVVAVPNIFNKEWLEQKYQKDIKAALQKLNTGVKTLEFKVSQTAGATTTEEAARPPAKSSARQMDLPKSGPSSLNSKYSFDSFVVGSSNELAYAACQAVVQNPGTKYNPLFIYGGTGLGKTHLIQAVGNEVLKRDPSRKVEYITSESFTSEFISAIVRNKTSFTTKYRKVDVLIIDDMQFLSGKKQTQEEFFHTFNALHQSNKQIIISSDKPPRALSTLEDRLRSRFESGMIADIQAPDYETRAAILQTKAAAQGVALGPDVVDLLAQAGSQNIRELEGILTQLVAYCELRNLEPTLATANSLMTNLNTRPRQRALSAKQIMDQTAKYFDLSIIDLQGSKRDKEIVVPRQIAMYLMRHELNLSFPKIAQSVGGRDHTTAMHSVSKIEKLLESHEPLREDVNTIAARLQAN